MSLRSNVWDRKQFAILVLLLFLFTVRLSFGEMKLISLDFEVFGRVQGVFFRKYTVEQGKLLGLRGTCMNTERGTVVGTLQGEKEKVEEMKGWLQLTGSPYSKISKAEFRNEKEIETYTLNDFKVLK